MKTPIPHNEDDRLRELYGLRILDAPTEQEFDDVVELASQICNVPISLISLLEINRQWFKAAKGLDVKETPRELAFCSYTITEDEDYFEVADTLNDLRFRNNPMVQCEPHLRFYAGTPLVTSRGFKVGTLCVADVKPNHLDEHQVFALKVLSQQVTKMIELKLQNRKLENQNHHLRHENEMQQLMLSIIAHDVRNPIGAIKGVMDFITCNDVPEIDKQKLTGMFSEQLDITLDLLNNLVDWSKMQINKAEIIFENLNLYDLAESILKQFKLSANHKNNQLVNLVDKDLFLKTDSNMIRFILRNLVANANKFTQDGTITLYAHGEADKIMFTVSDTGTGMTKEKVNNLFNKSKAQSTPGTNHEKGSGLGLILTKGFIDCLNGTVEVESEVGKGTAIYLQFKK
jgi:signal transduction histidine kinase